MSSLSFAYPSTEANFAIKNTLTRLSTITIDFPDTSASGTLNNVDGLIRELESKSVATTLPLTRSQKIKDLTNKKDIFIKQRNEIMDSLFRIYLPWNRKKLKDIDLEIDKIDLVLYELEKEDKLKISEIDKIVSFAEKRLEEQSLLLQEASERKQTQFFHPNCK